LDAPTLATPWGDDYCQRKQGRRGRRYQLDADAGEYLSHWVYTVLRELVQHPDFRDDPYWIQRRLTGRMELKEILQAFSCLRHKGLIFKDEAGRYHMKDEVIISSDEVECLAIRNYYRRALEQSLATLEDLPLEQREFGALFFQVPESSVQELKQKLKAFHRERHTWALDQIWNQSEQTEIQHNLLMFPQTKRTPT
jgi:uncharacterized protein (TIGR02147 family)